MGPQWHQRADRENSLLGHSGCRVGGNDLDIALAFKHLMPLLVWAVRLKKGSPYRFSPVERGRDQRCSRAK